MRNRWTSIVLVVALTVGWAAREATFAADRASTLPSRTVTLDRVALRESIDRGRRVGDVGVYFRGETEGGYDLVVGRFVIDPGRSAHEIHSHVQEEVLVVDGGQAEIVCDGRKTEAGPGSILYTQPNVPHGIDNSGDGPMTFTFIKWAPTAATGR